VEVKRYSDSDSRKLRHFSSNIRKYWKNIPETSQPKQVEHLRRSKALQ